MLRLCLQTFLLSLASLEAAMLSWLLPVIIFDGIFLEKRVLRAFQVELSVGRIQAKRAKNHFW
ncbi:MULTISPECIES: hypothetical protein [unclassified Microcoleus]|uniref:hypothetical protein n=1 Tax=unclassified Microcoleus TaxID=2642155 RepID=UPI002FD4F5A7